MEPVLEALQMSTRTIAELRMALQVQRQIILRQQRQLDMAGSGGGGGVDGREGGEGGCGDEDDCGGGNGGNGEIDRGGEARRQRGQQR
ncbi:hypothetical protein PTSG_12285 [Salpingoeca rosetta]|uniref:Uncharacterized protein n=1 Tax=Salpingoeca rosetta (strain ATCC 50818 / BSB-021) TaxID=946362 RepID=F2U9Y0_SALR5|nr:uncharacterized protein PTSG_12285 [Salpingoeca rosetta]EGD73555.1 hypothetical protein PTSG_12285 [Salpingoeca rosetta]|eukprot:XP_004993837.1 hypothetical protein PTSG_12285 [Salpingoeca rosetta]